MKDTFLLAAVTAAALISASGASATTPLVVAAGGGGAGSRFGCHDINCAGGAYIPGVGGGSNGNNGGGVGSIDLPAGGAGGHDGRGGKASSSSKDSGGGGGGGWGVDVAGRGHFFSRGQDGKGALAGRGGSGPTDFAGGLGNQGGFGGGGGGGSGFLGGDGGGGGGGGGYSGGGGGYGEVGFGGGGGGSYVDASLTFAGSAPGLNSGNGLVDLSGASAFTFSYTGGVQDYIVPLSGYYTITALGAQGGDGATGHGGLGAYAQGRGFFAAGTDLRIVVGGRGNGDFGSLTGGGGGGGSFVYYGAPVAVPEPATWALMISGCGMAGAALRRRRATVAA